MAVIRTKKVKNFTVISNKPLKEKKMSNKAKGMLATMLSLPDTWKYSISGLVAISKESRTAIKSALRELKEFGYLEIKKLYPNYSQGRKRIEYNYLIYEVPKSTHVSNDNKLNKESKVSEGKTKNIENLTYYTRSENVGKLDNNKDCKCQETHFQTLEVQTLENSPQLNTNKLNTNELSTVSIVSKKEEEKTKNVENSTYYTRNGKNKNKEANNKPNYKRESYNSIIARYSNGNAEISDLLKKFIQMRCATNKLLTNSGFEKILQRLDRFSYGHEMAKTEILDKSIRKSCPDVYPLSEQEWDEVHAREYLDMRINRPEEWALMQQQESLSIGEKVRLLREQFENSYYLRCGG